MLSRNLVKFARVLNAVPRYSISYRGQSGAGGEDLISRILQDHRNLEEYYKNYKAAKTEEDSHKWFNQFVWEISRHSVAEELTFYNLLEIKGDKGKELSKKSRDEQNHVKVLLEDLRHEKDPQKFDEKFAKVFNEVQDHLKTEETEDLPFLKEQFTEDQLIKAGKAFSMKQKIAPTRPHPAVPDKPTALELALGLFIAPVDKFRDLFVDFPDKNTTKA